MKEYKEVIHARWICTYPYLENNPLFMYGICSNCGAESNGGDYCYSCGATMDVKLKLTEYEEKCLFCKYNYKTLDCVPKCNCLCEDHSDFELIENIKEKF